MNPDDPRLTAYVLDELNPTARKEIEQLIKNDSALAAEAESSREFTAELRRQLRAEPDEFLGKLRRLEIVTGAKTPVLNRPRPLWWKSRMVGSIAAACAIMGAIATVFVQQKWVSAPGGTYAKRSAESPSIQLPGFSSSDEATFSPPVESSVVLDSDQRPLLAVAPPSPSALNPALKLDLGPEKMPALVTGESIAPQLGTSTDSRGIRLKAQADDRTTGRPEPQTTLAPVTMSKSRMAITSAPPRSGLQAGRARGATTVSKANSLELPSNFATSTGVASASPVPTMSPELTQIADRTPNGKRASRAELKAAFEKEMAQLQMGLSTADSMGGQPTTLLMRKAEAEGTLAALEKMGGHEDRRAALKQQIAQINEAAKVIEESEKVQTQWLERMQTLTREIEAIPEEGGNTEAYDAITDNPFLTVKEQPLSTFSIDVDTASYANVRRFLNANQLPPKGAVRIEELVNYFRYDYPQPEGDDPFSCTLEVATCPWQPEHRLVRIGLKGKELPREQRPSTNLVFLIDVSGSMQPENKLPLVKESLRLLIQQLGPDDSVAIAVYAGASGCVLEPTHDKEKVRAALDRLDAGGSTNGAAGIQLAYNLAQRAFQKGGSNRVILLTDGDFNVGVTDQSQLISMIEGKAKTGIFLSVLGFGMGNLKDSTLEKLADKGNGNYAYIDTLREGRRIFVEQMAGTLFTIAKDVKVQVEFNPAQVGGYRLIGYENRLLAKEDFNDDTKDAGEIGAGHSVTALYEIVPAGKEAPGVSPVDDLKYQAPRADAPAAVEPPSKELLTVKLRYKQPNGDVSKKLEFPLIDTGATWEKSSRDFRWASAVAGFGMMLRDSPHRGTASWALIEELATEGQGADHEGYRGEFVGLIERAKALSR